jgi:antitoxin ParD1/3/4
MNISLTPELDLFVATKVSSGRYTSASEVVREALPLSEKTEQNRKAQIAAFNLEIGRRLQSLDGGVSVDAAEVFERSAKRSEQRRKRKK